jgi:phage terminase small subunit
MSSAAKLAAAQKTKTKATQKKPASIKEKVLTPRQARFVEEYLVDLNASQAAVRSGYKGDPNTVGPRLLADVGIRSLVEQAQAQRSQKVELTQERVLLELKRLALFDIRKIFNADGTLKRVVDLDDDTAAAIMSVEMVEIGTDGQLAISKKFKASDKKGALELTMRHMGMLNDKLEITMPTVRIKDFTGKA